MKITSVLGASVVMAGAISFAAAVIKRDVCHVTNVPDKGDGVVISISDQAWPAHEMHGDKEVDPSSVSLSSDGTKCHVCTEPKIKNICIETDVNKSVTIELLENVDLDEDEFVLSLLTGPSNGSLSPFVGTSIVYAPDESFTGGDSFDWELTTLDCYNTATATVTICIGTGCTCPTT